MSRQIPLSPVVAFIVVTATAVSFDSRVAMATESEAQLLELTTERVVVFKDGYCLVIKQGTVVADDQGRAYLDDVPDSAVLGSFWATPRAGRLVSLTTGWREAERVEEREVPCLEKIEVLEANAGREATIELSDGSVHTGVIERVLARKTTSVVDASLGESLDIPAARRATTHALRSPTTHPDVPASPPTISGIEGRYFVLATGVSDLLLEATQIRKMTIKDMRTTVTRTLKTTERTRRITFRFADARTEHDVMVMYFRPGVRWIPTYRVNLTRGNDGKKLAEVNLQAELINEAEDLVDTPLDIVVGVPNFRFRSIPSPLTLERMLRNALQQAAPQLMGQFRNDLSNALYSQRASEVQRTSAPPAASPGDGGVALPAELTAAGAQDLFVYSLPRMTLRKGERAAVPVFRASAPYRDVFTWDLHLKRQDMAVAPTGSGAGSPLALSRNEVWRQIEITNTTKQPWTTGTAMLMDGRQPLAQELLTYTSASDTCRIPVTVSVDTRGSFREEETGRTLQALKWNGYHYARIDRRATLELKNLKDEAITAVVTVRFGGTVDSTSHDGDVTRSAHDPADWERYRGDPALNSSSLVRWRVNIEPGEVFRPVVESHYFTRH